MSTPDPEETGSVGEEAAKLFGVLADLAQGHRTEHLATGSPECTVCPVCRTVHVLRRTSPEVRAHLTAAAASLAQAAAGLLATAVPDEARARAAGVEPIDLDDDTDLDTDEWAEDE